jgi:hypothetical protein
MRVAVVVVVVVLLLRLLRLRGRNLPIRFPRAVPRLMPGLAVETRLWSTASFQPLIPEQSLQM